MCYLANGHIQVLSLPSLRPLMDVDCLPLTDLRCVSREKYIPLNMHCSSSYFSKSKYQKSRNEWLYDAMVHRIAKTWSCGNGGHIAYFATPSEIQRVTISADIAYVVFHNHKSLYLSISLFIFE